MAKYAVNIKEVLSKTVIVDTGSFDDAVDVVKAAYSNCDIILEADDISDKAEIGPSETFGEDAIDENDERLEYFSMYPAEEV